MIEIRKYLDISAKINDANFEQEVIAAGISKLKDIQKHKVSKNGEEFISNVASNLNIKFEEIHSIEDVIRIKNIYLNEQHELWAGQLELELNQPDVDALLFKQQNKPEHYVAVLNLQNTNSRAYWNKSHETSHRLIEPPQKELFHRHRTNQKNRIEHIVDTVASEIAFYEPIFKPIVESYSSSYLSWNIVKEIQKSFAPTSSLMSVTKAIIKYWPIPVFLLSANYRGRASNPMKDQALRTSIIGMNELAYNSKIFFFQNMRAPVSSIISHSFSSGTIIEGEENLANWVTSSGSSLPSRNALISAQPYHNGTLALINLS